MSRNNHFPGKFITFEGIDGSGKSSVIQAVAAHLESIGIPLLITRQPGGTPLGEKIRDILKNPETRITSITEVLLFATSFRECLDKVIRPALGVGHWVLCDRWTDSTMAYQCGGRAVTRDVVEAILSASVTTNPDLTFYCDLLPETAAQRAANRGALDRFEKEGLELQRAVHGFYQKNTAKNPKTVVISTETLDEEASGLEAVRILKEHFIIP